MTIFSTATNISGRISIFNYAVEYLEQEDAVIHEQLRLPAKKNKRINTDRKKHRVTKQVRGILCI